MTESVIQILVDERWRERKDITRWIYQTIDWDGEAIVFSFRLVDSINGAERIKVQAAKYTWDTSSHKKKKCVTVQSNEQFTESIECNERWVLWKRENEPKPADAWVGGKGEGKVTECIFETRLLTDSLSLSLFFCLMRLARCIHSDWENATVSGESMLHLHSHWLLLNSLVSHALYSSDFGLFSIHFHSLMQCVPSC